MPFNLTGGGTVTYNTASKFGQSLNGGYGYSTTQPVSVYPITIRGTVKAASSGNIEVAAGTSGIAWFGKAADNTALAHYGFGTDVTLASTINIADGAYHEIELSVTSTGGTLFVDGVVAATSTTAPTAGTGRYFGARAFFSTANSATATFPWTGEIDQLAVFNSVQHTASYTPSTVAMTGGESNLAALYSFNGNLNDTAGSGAATALTISAPSGSSVGTPITVTVGFNGTNSGATANLTATDGTFNPTSVTIPANGVATSAYTPASAGTKTLTATDAAGTLSSASTTTTATNNVQVAYNNANIFYSPSNWDDRGTYVSSNNPGSYARVAFSGTSVGVKVDVSAMVAASLPAGSYPIVRTVIDGTAFVDTQLTSAGGAIMRTGLASGNHTLDVFFLAADINNGDRWITPVNAVRLTGFTLDAGAAVAAVTKRSKSALFFFDSIGEGYLAAGTVTTQPVGNNCLLTTIPSIAKAVDAEYGTIAFSGQGYEQAGNNGAVALPAAYAFYSSGRSRLVSGFFSPGPDFIFLQHGTNGTTTQADVAGMITNLRAAAPNARIFMIVPANGSARSQTTAAVAAAADPKVNLIDIGTGYAVGIGAFGGGANMYSLDGLHPNPLSNAQVAAADMRAIQTVLDSSGPALSSRTLSITLRNASGVLANLTGMQVSIFDDPTRAAGSAIRYQTLAGTTDANGVFTTTYQSTLAAGATCGVDIRVANQNFCINTTVS